MKIINIVIFCTCVFFIIGILIAMYIFPQLFWPGMLCGISLILLACFNLSIILSKEIKNGNNNTIL